MPKTLLLERPKMTTFPGRLIREPLLHFFALGLLVFILYGRGEPVTTAPSGQLITVTGAQLAQLSAQYEAAWRRPPAEDERAALIEDFLREEIYYREALALGLDRDDAVIRRRLRQKMEFLGDGAAAAVAPDEAELRAHHAAHAERFAAPARVTFRQVALLDAADAEAMRLELAAGADPRELGRGGLLPDAMEAARETVVDGVFGAGFFARVERLTPGEWQGPVQSAYGPHLIHVEAFETGTAAEFEAVRDLVLQDWRRATAAALREAQFTELRSRYTVILPEGAE